VARAQCAHVVSHFVALNLSRDAIDDLPSDTRTCVPGGIALAPQATLRRSDRGEEAEQARREVQHDSAQARMSVKGRGGVVNSAAAQTVSGKIRVIHLFCCPARILT
jgi:hypothetical protein